MDYDRAYEVFRKHGVDGCLISSGENVFYATGFRTIPSVPNRGIFNQTRLQNAVFVVFPLDGEPTLTVSFGFYGVARAQAKVRDIRCTGTGMYVDRSYSDPEVTVFAQSPLEAVVGVMKEKGLDKGRVACEQGFMPGPLADALQKALPKVEWVDAKEILLEIKMVKTPAEIETIRQAVDSNVYAIKRLIDVAAEGITEKEMLDTYKAALIERGCDWGTTTLGGGGNSGEPYNVAGSYVLKRGDMIRFDLCPVYDGYFSDLARCVAIGEIPVEHRRLFNVVHDAEARMVDAIRPGVRMNDLFRIGMETVQREYPSFTRPNLGHNVGVFVHEEPDIGPNNVQLEPGMVLAVEVPYYIPGVVGVNVENNVLVTDDGFEVLDADLPTSLFVK